MKILYLTPQNKNEAQKLQKCEFSTVTEAYIE